MFRKHKSYSNRSTSLALEATTNALLDSGLLDEKSLSNTQPRQQNLPIKYHDPTRIGTSLGTTLLGFIDITKTEQTVHETGRFRNAISPYFIPRILNNTPSGVISMSFNLKGPTISHSEACATGNHSIGDGYLNIKYGRADCMVVGATDSCLDPSVVGGFNRIRALTKAEDVNQASIPFDQHRSGFVMGEGAGCLVLEDLESAQARGAEIYAEIIGYSATNDAFHITAPSSNGEAAYNAMKFVLEEGKLSQETETDLKIGYVNAHATSTPIGDDIELNSIKRIFQNSSNLPYVTSSKGHIGHLLAAAGTVEAIFTIMSMRKGIILPTLNTQNVSQMEYEKLVTGQVLETRLDYAISNSFGFGGNNSSLLFKKFEN